MLRVMETGDKSVVCIDVGTTNARAWLVSGDEVLARAQTQVGVRDTAREGSATRLRAALKDLIARVCAGAPPEDEGAPRAVRGQERAELLHGDLGGEDGAGRR